APAADRLRERGPRARHARAARRLRRSFRAGYRRRDRQRGEAPRADGAARHLVREAADGRRVYGQPFDRGAGRRPAGTPAGAVREPASPGVLRPRHPAAHGLAVSRAATGMLAALFLLGGCGGDNGPSLAAEDVSVLAPLPGQEAAVAYLTLT